MISRKGRRAGGRRHEHVELLRSSRNLRFIRLGLSDSHGLLVVSVDGVVSLPLPLGRFDPEHSQSLFLQDPEERNERRQSAREETRRTTNDRRRKREKTNLVSEILSLPSVNHALGLEVVEIVEVEGVVLGSELGGSRLSSLDDLVDVVVDEKAARQNVTKKSAKYSSFREVRTRHEEELTCSRKR